MFRARRYYPRRSPVLRAGFAFGPPGYLLLIASSSKPIDGLSIGYRTVRGRTDAKTGIRSLIEVDLWEISVVTFPMLPEARVEAVKSRDRAMLIEAIRRATAAMRVG